MVVLFFAVACGSSAEPAIVEKEVIREVVKEVPVIKEVIKEVPVEVIVEKELIRELVKEITVIATAVPVLSVAAKRPAWVDIGEQKQTGATSLCWPAATPASGTPTTAAA